LARGNLTDVKKRYDDLAKSISDSKSDISAVSDSLRRMFNVLQKINKPMGDFLDAFGDINTKAGKAVESVKKQAEAMAELTETTTNVTNVTNQQTVQMAERIKLDKAQFSQLKRLIKGKKEAVVQEEELIDGSKRFKDSLLNLRTEISSVTEVTKDMGKGFFESASNSKAWTAASRVLSGSGLWKVQNRIRALIDVGAIWEKSKAKSAEKRAKETRAIENLRKVQEQLASQTKLLADAENDAAKMKDLMETDSYKLMQKRGLEHDQIIHYMREELALMDDQLEAQNKIIKGSKLKRNIEAAKATLDMGIVKLTGGKDSMTINQEELEKIARKNNVSLEELTDEQKEEAKGRANRRKVFQKSAFMMVYFSIALMAFILLSFVIFGAIADIKDNIEEGKGMWLVAWQMVSLLFNTGFAILQEAFGFVSDLINGNMDGAMDHAMKLMDKLLIFAGVALGTIAVIGFNLLASLWSGIHRWWTEAEDGTRRKLFVMLVKALGWFAGYLLIRYIVVEIAAIAAGILGSIPLFVVALGAVIIAGIATLLSALPFMSAGGTSHGGLTVVGEQGPELINTKPGDKIINHTNTRKMVGRNGASNNITVNVNGRLGASDQELKDLARKLGPLILQEINRKTSANMY
tara:strand:- start:3043 stop:4947 length:1905 start_codon:yes stop_codon:yes gene_type:complete